MDKWKLALFIIYKIKIMFVTVLIKKGQSFKFYLIETHQFFAKIHLIVKDLSYKFCSINLNKKLVKKYVSDKSKYHWRKKYEFMFFPPQNIM